MPYCQINFGPSYPVVSVADPDKITGKWNPPPVPKNQAATLTVQ
jgi:hypothetical protein